MRILIVEDEEKLAEATKKGLELKGFTVDWLAEGEKARTRMMLYRDEYDLVLLDLMLPGVDGATICKDVREAGVTTPIIVLTARDETDTKIDLLNLGADDYLAKPFSFDELVARMNAVLRRPEQALPSVLTVRDHVWSFDFPAFSNVLDVHMKNLRKKLDDYGEADPLFETIRGIGYRLNG